LSRNKDWVPDGINAFNIFAENFCRLVELNATTWKVSNLDKSKLTALKAEYDSAREAADTPLTRNSITIAEANRARKALVTHMRYLKRVYIDPGFEAGIISLGEYMALGLTPHSTTHTPVANPTSRPVLFDLKDMGGFAVQMHFRDEHVEHSQAILPGCNGCLVHYHYGPEKLMEVQQLTFTQLFTQSPVFLQLPPEAEGMWLSIAPSWQLDKDGVLGPWGTIEYVRVT
jgi:hypothetical protein